MSEPVAISPGFFGKVRTHGDFVSRRLPPAFIEPWDDCLQKGMLFAQKLFGAQWLPVYLNAPVWRFALGAGACGSLAWVGVLMPGVDQVGRYFPFTIAAPLEGGALVDWLTGARRWFDVASQLALSTLADDFALERFDAALSAAELAQTGAEALPWAGTVVDETGASEAFAERLVTSMTPARSAWWSDGSDAVPGTLRIGAGLPDERRFASLLDVPCPGWEWIGTRQA
ncbi:type VI secretion system-associated protein TagF [Paraburkholderia sediminicola]|uniref:type VI secretion system-associated protein TagF n=1 Tax=Paraburkholderia sediminicola TaxID=458836 RepID=UPI0038BA1ED4